MKFYPTTYPTICIAFLVAVPLAHAQFTTIDDFESFNNGDTISGSNGWTGDADNIAVTDPDDASNTVLQQSANGVDALQKTFSSALSSGDTATLFYQFRIDTTAARDNLDHGFGVGGDNTLDFDSFRAYTALRQTNIQYRNDTDFDTAVTTNNVAIGTWYSAWIVADQGAGTSGTYDFYHEEGRNASPGTAIANNIDFRGGGFLSGAEIDRFMIISGNGINADSNDAFLDNIYWDSSGANLVNPVPEPSAFAALAGVAALGLALVRRRR